MVLEDDPLEFLPKQLNLLRNFCVFPKFKNARKIFKKPMLGQHGAANGYTMRGRGCTMQAQPAATSYIILLNNDI